MRRVSVRFNLGENRRYDSFFRRLHCLGAFPVMNSEWWLPTPFSLEELEMELRALIDPADRLLVTFVGAVSSRNLINRDRVSTNSA